MIEPEHVLKPLLERVTLPDSVIELLYYLLKRRIEERPYYDEAHAVSDIHMLANFFLSFAKFQDVHGAPFTAPLWCYAGMSYDEYRWRANPGLRMLEEQESRRLRKDEQYVDVRVDTFWRDLLTFDIGFSIPERTRYEHTHILADSGMGKSVLLRHLIQEDLKSKASVIVLSPKGALIPELLKLKVLDPERTVYVSPATDITLNPFDLGIENEEILTNQAFALLIYMFEAMQITEKQKPLLYPCIRLLLKTPGASFPMLTHLLQQNELPEFFMPHLAKLDPDIQQWFLTRFNDQSKSGYKETKQELQWRIDNVLGGSAKRMFSGATSAVRLPHATRDGKVVLVDTSNKVLGLPGSAFLGRFFIGMAAITAMLRDGQKNARPCYVYLDEVDLYTSSYLKELLARGREAHLGVTMAHLWLSQLGACEEAAYLCSTKFVGGLQNESDARKMAGMLKEVEPKWLQNQERWSFYLQIRGVTKQRALRMDFSNLLTFLESLPQKDTRHTEHAHPVPLLLAAQPEPKYEAQVDSEDPSEW